jgi:hypothetical protein
MLKLRLFDPVSLSSAVLQTAEGWGREINPIYLCKQGGQVIPVQSFAEESAFCRCTGAMYDWIFGLMPDTLPVGVDLFKNLQYRDQA